VELYTIGHGNLTFEEFRASLLKNGITRVVDVRSMPSSRHAPWSNRRTLTAELQAIGLVYQFAGKELGGKPGDPALLGPTGEPDYDRITASAAYHRGIQDLLDKASQERVAIMCSELNPLDCHRERLIGRTMRSLGFSVNHILRDGSIMSEIQETLPLDIFTIGYTRKSLRRATDLLREAGVDIVVDVRLRNTSQLAGWSKKDDLAFVLELVGIQYTHRPDLAPTDELLDRYRKDKDWARYEVDYRALMEERGALPVFREYLASYERPCLLCSEHEPVQCHRRLLVEKIADGSPDVQITHLM
jgi:uncharacterized protein (DUF488 family)